MIKITLKNGVQIEMDGYNKEVFSALRALSTDSNRVLVGNGRTCKLCGVQLTNSQRVLCSSKKCHDKRMATLAKKYYRQRKALLVSKPSQVQAIESIPVVS